MDGLFTIAELYILRQSLDIITIQGKDARNVANLQEKIENIIHESQTVSDPEIASKKK
jgi:hypothetical protein